MCLEFPGRVVRVSPDGATVDTEGRLRTASTILNPDVRIGDWVIVAAGTIIRRLTDDDAAEIRRALRQAIVRTRQ